MLQFFVDCLFPERCSLCGELGSSLCQDCADKIKRGIKHRQDWLVSGSQRLSVYSCKLYDYEDDWARLIKRYKYKFSRELNYYFAERMYDLVWSLVPELLKEDVAFVPVPLAYLRKSWRGYNQAELIAQKLADVSGGSVWKGVKRRKNTKSQAKLTAKQRRKNLQGAFEVSGAIPKYVQKVVLVDDVVTTGSTLRACWDCLRKQNPDKNYAALSLASRLVF